MTNEEQTPLAIQARQVYDTQGETAMLRFLERNRRPPRGPEHDFQGYVVLADGSTIEMWREQYRFGDQANRTAQAAAPKLGEVFTGAQALYCNWPTTANLYHHAMKLMEERLTGKDDDGSDPPLSEPEACARWPELEEQLRSWAVNTDPGDTAFNTVLDDMHRKAGDILASLDQEILDSMKGELSRRLQAEKDDRDRLLPE